MKLRQILKNHRLDISYLPLLICAIITIGVIYVIYIQTQNILTERLRERLLAIAATASLQFEASDIEKIRNEKDLSSLELKRTIEVMNDIRNINKDLRYIYIWRKTADPNQLEFVADGEMLDPIDIDENGKIEGVEIPPVPGEDYDITEFQSVLEAFEHPTAQKDFLIDKWGIFLSGFAPIKDKEGNAVAILGIDVEVRDFYRLIRATLIPFIGLAVLLLLILTIQTISLIRIWRSRVEIVKELDRQKDELLSIVSHQLATPITSVKWYLEMMMSGDVGSLTQEQEDHVKSMQSVVVNLVDLVGMILDVSRIQLGRMKIEKKELDLNSFFKEILQIINPKAKEKGVEFFSSIPQFYQPVMLDKRYTHMTLENLLSNAIKYTPSGGKVSFVVKVIDNKMHCEIIDSGCGIPQGDHARIFEKLFRASNVRNSVDGNGFGLYVAKGAVEAQGGKIRFISKEGTGTTFFIELPLS